LEAPATADGATVLDAVRRAVLHAIAYQDVPMSSVWRQLIRDRLLAPNFAVHEWIVFDFVNVNTETEAGPWSRVWARIDGRQSKPEFAIVVEDNSDEFTLVCRYPTVCFTPAVESVLHDLHAVMGRLVSSPQEPIGRYADLLHIASPSNTPSRSV
jgi:hypothetical protein